MQRRTLNFRYVLPVTLFVLAQVVLIALVAAASSTTAPATKVSASSLYSHLTTQKQNAASLSHYLVYSDASMYSGTSGYWQILRQSSGQENPAAIVSDTATITNSPTDTFTPCPSTNCTSTPTPIFTSTSTHTHTATSTATSTSTFTL